MKISTKGRYGLRIMLELAICHGRNLLTAREIADQQQISEKYIEQIVGILTKAGLVKSQRGVNGGYRLADSPQEVTVGRILRVTEGGLRLIDCAENGGEHCHLHGQCVTRDVWTKMANAIEDVADSITLADLVARHNETFHFAYMI
jgi:Rrf2 family protein